MKHKKGFELSVNFVVMMVIALVVFSMGIYFLGKIISSAEDVNEKRQNMLDTQFKNLRCSSSERVCASETKKSGKPGEQVFFAINVRNVLDGERIFVYSVDNDEAFDNDKQPILVTNLLTDDQIYPGDFTLEETVIGPLTKYAEDKGIIEIVIPEDAIYGTYILNAEVQYKDNGNTNEYGKVKLYLEVAP